MNSPTRSLYAYDDSDPENKPVHPLIPIGRTVFLGTPEDGKTCTLMNLLFRPDIVKHLRRFYKGGCIRRSLKMRGDGLHSRPRSRQSSGRTVRVCK